MSHPASPQPRRKRSRAVGLTSTAAMGALSLAACDDAPTQPVVD